MEKEPIASQEGIKDLSEIEAEENSGLEKFYQELNPQVLDRNFDVWREKLVMLLGEKYPDELQREEALKEAARFSKGLALFHTMPITSADLFMQNPQLKSNFRVDSENIEHATWRGAGTNSDDRRKNRDKFAYLHYGNARYFGHDAFVIAFTPEVLGKDGVIVSLEDPPLTMFRLNKKSGKSHVDWNDGWEQHLKESWRGQDFKELLPYFLAVSYDDFNDFFSKGLDFRLLDGVPEDKSGQYKTQFEVSVPRQLNKEDILFYASSKNDQSSSLADKPQIAIPPQVSNEQAYQFLYSESEKILDTQ